MSADPLYSTQASDALDSLEASGDTRLWNAVCDAIDLICDHGDSAEARREQLRTQAGSAVWKLSVRTFHDDLVVLWWPDDDHLYIGYIGKL